MAKSQQRTILIVEDEEINQLLLTQILSGYETLHAYDGMQALDMIRDHASELSMIILDLVIPGMDGLEVLRRVKAGEKTRDIPVVIMSAQDDKEGDTLELGAMDFLRKPYADPRVIRAKVANIIKFSESVKIVNAETHDEITGLLNMRTFLKEAQRLQKLHVAGGVFTEHAVVFCDLANFKNFNMRFGIQKGDQCLKKTAAILKNTFEHSLLSRFADDHFVLVAECDGLKEKLEEANVQIRRLGNGVPLHLKSGIKYSEENDRETDISMLCDLAQMACDQLSNEEEHPIAVYDKKVREERRRREYLIENLDRAIEEGHIKVYLQPVVRSLSGNLCGAEALVRWIDPELGFLSPGEFIPVLEDARLIHKVDIFVIREVCKGYRRRMEQGKEVIPISFNLSRLDFMLTDIRKVILDAVEEYRVPRDMINVEITESLFANDKVKIKKDITDIKKSGFKIWMDDFGSGYSSLNLLKDYDFDELKIDMAFLSSFTDKSKNILRSIVRMAKEIGIQTLAEGVETQEQFEFLRSIGCEKIQGYYFGKPMPMGEVIPYAQEKGMKIETRAWADFYDKAGKINFLDERSMALLLDDTRKVKFLFANEAFMESLRSNGTDSLESATQNVNAPGSPMQRIYRKLADDLIASLGQEKEITYPAGTQYMSARGKVIATCNGKYLHLSSLTNVTRNADAEKQSSKDSLVRNVMYLFDTVSEINLLEGTLKNYDIAQDGTGLGDTGEAIRLETDMEAYVKAEIYLADQQRFIEFADLKTLKQRILDSRDGTLSGYFRCREKDGNYHWRVHILMAVPKTDHNRVLIFTRRAQLDEAGTQKDLIDVYKGSQVMNRKLSQKGQIPEEVLWYNLRNYVKVKYFWKDSQRRFLGASQSFLDYYGLQSVEEILGKTDEEMHWHVANDPYRDDEWQVLQEGRHTRNVPGKCIIRGVVHNIFASKMPLYLEGQIIGLIGYFADGDEAAMAEDKAREMATLDPVTKIYNARGLMESFLNYNEEFKSSGKDFVVIGLDVDGYEQLRDAFGQQAGDDLLNQITGILHTYFKNDAALGRLQSGKFMALYQMESQDYLQEVLQKIQTEIKAITEVDGYPCTCFPQVQISHATDDEKLEEMVKAFWK